MAEQVVGAAVDGGAQEAVPAGTDGVNRSFSSYRMSGWVRLCRLLTSTFDEPTPAGTGLPASSTHSAMQVSLAKVNTVPPGSLRPTRPSVETNKPMTGTPNASPIAVRSSGPSASEWEMTDRRLSFSRPSRCSRARSASLAA